MTQSIVPFSISRVFNAPRHLVFKMNTDVNHLSKWMSPDGFKTIQASMDFQVGGIYHYGLEGPSAMYMWGKQVFREIVPNERLSYIHSFSDENGGNTRHPMSATWPLEMLATTVFEEIDGNHTRVIITWQPWNSDDIGYATFNEARSGMAQGFSGTFAKLEEHIKSLSII